MHKGLKAELLIAATYRGEEFRKAYVQEYARIYMANPLQSKTMMGDQIRAARDYDEFLVAIYTQEKKWDDFSEKDSLWKVYLIRDGRFRAEPLEIRKIEKNRKLFESFYPFISPWSSIYIFRFKKQDQSHSYKSVELLLTSAPGSTKIAWDLHN